MNKKFLGSIAGLLMLAFSGFTTIAEAVPVDQYASSVISFSSQWSSTSWSAAQVIGAPNTLTYGDILTSWAPLPINGTLENITVGFTSPVYAGGVTIRETYGNGFVYKVDVLDMSDVLHTIWSGVDPSVPGPYPGSPVDFLASWSPTGYLVKGVKIYTDTNHDTGAWEEIDSIQLHGDTTAPSSVPEPASMLLLGFGLAGLAAFGFRIVRRTS